MKPHYPNMETRRNVICVCMSRAFPKSPPRMLIEPLCAKRELHICNKYVRTECKYGFHSLQGRNFNIQIWLRTKNFNDNKSKMKKGVTYPTRGIVPTGDHLG